MIATALVVGGFYMALTQWDRVWLVFSAAGVVVIFIGSCVYLCGTNALRRKYRDQEEDSDQDAYRRRRRQKQRGGGTGDRSARERGLSGDELVPSAPPSGDSRSVSQLSLNMIPQYFSRAETASNVGLSSGGAPTGVAYSQIFSVGGQSFLILPLTGDSLAGAETNIPLNGLVVKLPIKEDENLR